MTKSSFRASARAAAPSIAMVTSPKLIAPRVRSQVNAPGATSTP